MLSKPSPDNLIATSIKLIEKTIAKQGYYTGIFFGTSMMPLFIPGTKLWIISINRTSKVPHRGQILMVKKASTIIIHRLIRKNSFQNHPYFLTQGDACTIPDGWFSLSDILGVVYQYQINRHSPPINLESPWENIKQTFTYLLKIYSNIRN